MKRTIYAISILVLCLSLCSCSTLVNYLCGNDPLNNQSGLDNELTNTLNFITDLGVELESIVDLINLYNDVLGDDAATIATKLHIAIDKAEQIRVYVVSLQVLFDSLCGNLAYGSGHDHRLIIYGVEVKQ